jgi:hypothetical protein
MVNDKDEMRDWTAPDDDITPPEPPPAPTAKVKRRRRIRPLLWALEVMGALVAALVLAVVLLAVRLEFGPIEVDFLTPMLVAYLNTQADPLTVEIDRTSLSWVKGRSTVDLIGAQLRIADPSGNNVVSIPELSVSVNLRALIAGRFAASRIAIFGPHLRLIRAATGEVGIDLGNDTPAASAGRPALAEPPPSLQDVWEAFAGKPSADRSLSYLDRISIEQADVTVDDRKAGLVWHIGEGAVDFTRRGDGLDAELVAALGVGQTETHLFGHLRYATEGKILGFSLGWDAFDPSQLAPALPAPYDAAAAALRLPVSGEGRGEIGLGTHALGPLHVQLDAGPGGLADPVFAGGRLDLAELKIQADYAPADNRLTLSRLLLDVGGPSIEVTGAVEHVPADPLALLDKPAAAPMTANVNIALHAMPIDKLGGFWPPTLSGHTRSWIMSNMSAGSIDDLRFAVAATLQPGAETPFDVSGFSGAMTVKGTNVEYMHGLPRVEGIDSSVTFQPKKLEFTLSSGRLKGLNISQGTIVIDQFDQPFERTTIDLALAGPAQDVMTVIDSKPLGYASKLGIEPKLVGGAVDGTLHFQFPLRNSLPLSDIDYGATAKLTGLAVGKVALGRDLSDGNFALTLNSDAVTLDGTAKLDGLAGAIAWKQHLSSGGGVRSETHVKTTLDDAARQRFGLDFLPENLHGPVGADLVYTEFAEHRARAAASLDLGAATLDVESFDWHKPPGQPAHGDFNAEFVDGHLTRLADLALRGPRLEVRGDLGFAEGGKLTELRAPKFRLGETDAALTILRPTGPGGPDWQITMHGPVIDLTEPVKQFEKKPSVKRTDPGPTIELDVQSEQIVLGPERVLRNAKLTGTIADRGLAEGKLSAGIGGGKLDFRLDRVEAGGQFGLNTDDFGALLKVGGVSDDVVGGKIAATGRSVRDGNYRRFTGHVEGSDYRFNGAPFMVRLLSLASFASIENLLNGDGIPFTTLKGDVTLYDGKLELSHARAYGGAIGINVDGNLDLDAGSLDLDGTLVPAYTLNSALGNLPIVGDLLMGGEGQGVFSANFRLAGQIEKPTITVNPLSPLAPGFLRRLFLFDAPTPDTSKPPPDTGK